MFKKLKQQHERVRSALVVYALTVMEEAGIESTPERMKLCLIYGETYYDNYTFHEHGPYNYYIMRLLKEILVSEDGA